MPSGIFSRVPVMSLKVAPKPQRIFMLSKPPFYLISTFHNAHSCGRSYFANGEGHRCPKESIPEEDLTQAEAKGAKRERFGPGVTKSKYLKVGSGLCAPWFGETRIKKSNS
jgi:hypothetical protein